MDSLPGVPSSAGICLVLLVVVLAGCSGPTWSSGSPPTFEQTARAVDGDGTRTPTVKPVRPDTTSAPQAPPSTIPEPATTVSPEGTETPATTATSDTRTVGYAIRAAGVDAFESVNVTLTVAFGVGCRGTSTAAATAAIECVRFGNVTVDLTALNETESVGQFTVPRSVANGSTLLVRDVEATLANGTRVSVAHSGLVAPMANGTAVRGLNLTVTQSGDGTGYALGAEWFVPDADVTSPSYAFATDGPVQANESLTVRVTRNGAPASLPVAAVGAAESRYVTDENGTATVQIMDTSHVAFEVVIDGNRTA